MPRPTPLSGFPEFLPNGRIVEQAVLDRLRETFELHGFASIETRAVETMDQLTRKGEITKEVYVVRRLHAAEGEAGDDLGLHFDLTVPFARYVLENAGHLAFPFRRYRSRRCGAASARRRAATASSSRPTSTSSARRRWPTITTSRWRW